MQVGASDVSAPGRRRWRFGVVAMLLALVAGAVWLLGLVSLERHVGYFGPAFGDEGSAVYYIERRSNGIVWGFGWEHLTPPAKARAFSDALRLQRLDLTTGDVVTLETWDGSPIVGRTLEQYRGRLFSPLQVGLRPGANGAVEYRVQLSLPRQPLAEVHRLQGVWAADAMRRRGHWDAAPGAPAGPSEPLFDGERELFTLPGPQGFPAAIVLLDHAERTIRVLQRSPAYAAQSPAGPPLASLLAVSRKAEHDRIRERARIERERIADYRAQGMNDGEAILRAGRDLRDLGYAPKPQRWIATLLSAPALAAHASLPRLDIAEMEFKVGLFPDLEQAMAAPGQETDRRFSRYLRHSDYDSSERLNQLLAAGTTELLIGRDGRVFHFRLLPAEPAARTRRQSPN